MIASTRVFYNLVNDTVGSRKSAVKLLPACNKSRSKARDSTDELISSLGAQTRRRRGEGGDRKYAIPEKLPREPGLTGVRGDQCGPTNKRQEEPLLVGCKPLSTS